MSSRNFSSICLILLINLFAVLTYGQEAGSIPGSIDQVRTSFPQNHQLIDPGKTIDPQTTKGTAASESYFTYSYTFSDLLIFSYEDNADISVYNASNDLIWTGTLHNNQFQSLAPGAGVYGVKSSKPFSLLIGDPVSHLVLGYYAMDEQGRGVSKEFLTYIPDNYFGTERLVVFGYTDHTLVEITDLQTGNLLWTGILSADEYYSSPNINDQFLHIEASNPVSVLSYTDQGYLLPDKSGDWTGTEFLGYAGYVGSWPNDLNLVSYEDNAHIQVLDLETGTELWSGSLNEGEIHNMTLTQGTTQEVFFKVISDKKITASIAPFGYYKGQYAYLSDCSDATGKRIGNLFYVPAIGGGVMAFNSFEDNNTVTITDLSGGAVVYSNIVNSGDFVSLNTSNVLYKIESTGKIAGNISCQGTAGGSFVPVYYGLDLPDLTVVSSTFTILPEDVKVGDQVTLSVELVNRGSNDIYAVEIGFYDGNPLQGGFLIGHLQTIDVIPGGGQGTTISTEWTVPEGPEYRQIYVFADPANKIKESSESNNIASIPLVPNDDLKPPLAVVVNAPEKLQLNDEGEFDPPSFLIEAVVINDSEADAYNVRCYLDLPDGLELSGGESLEQALGTVYANTSRAIQWEVMPTGTSYGDMFYSIQISADNTETKVVNRKIMVPEPGPQREVSVTLDGNSVKDAMIYVDRGDGFKLVGTTTLLNQTLSISNLPEGTKIRGVKKIHNQDAEKKQHEDVDKTMFELWMDTDIMNKDGTYRALEISSSDEDLRLELGHPIYKYNLTVTTDEETWSIGDDYMDKLEEGFKQASKLLYNATDGQAMLNKIAIYDKRDHFKGSDVLLHNFQKGNYCDEIDGIDHKYESGPSYPSKLHMHRTHIYKGHEPNKNDWYHSFVHEFGHYGFGIYDEYLNGLGVSWRSYAEYNWNAGGKEHPLNYGLMQSHPNVTEFSSQNDYLETYPDEYDQHAVTKQWDERKLPCFEYLRQKLSEYHKDVEMKLPPPGFYPNGFIYDRQGPSGDFAYEALEVIDMRSTTKSVGIAVEKTKISVTLNDSPAPGALVYVLNNGRRDYLGRTSEQGELNWFSPVTGGRLIVFLKSEGRLLRREVPVDSLPAGIQVAFVEDEQADAKRKSTAESDVPGICFSGIVSYDNTLNINTIISPDLVLESVPEITVYYDGNIETPLVTDLSGNMSEFSSETTIYEEQFTSDEYSGTGYFDVVYTANSQTYYATSFFKIFRVTDAQSSMHYNRSFNLHLEKENFSEPELAISFTTLGQPCGIMDQSLYPVADVFSYSMEHTESLAERGGLNIEINLDDSEGLDLSTLGIYMQNVTNGGWNKVETGSVNVEGLSGSCEVTSPGHFCLMATTVSDDLDAPERIYDLAAATGTSQSMIELQWTVPDDNDLESPPHYYVIRFNEVPITHLNWDESMDLYGEPTPGSVDEAENFALKMPMENKLYYFAMKSVDKAGNESELSNYASAISAVQKYTFSLESPAFNDTLNDMQPEFRWEMYNHPEVTYTLMYDQNELFTNPVVVSGIDTNRVQLDHYLDVNKDYFWKVVANIPDGDAINSNQSYSRFVTRYAVGIEQEMASMGYHSGYFYPNPYNPGVTEGTLRFTLPDPGTVRVSIFDMNGRCINILSQDYHAPGSERVMKWNGRSSDQKPVPGGLYIYRLEQNGREVFSGKILIHQ